MADMGADVICKLEEAFGFLPIPREDDLVLDNSGYHLECNEVKALLKGKHWRDLTINDLEHRSDALSFLSPTAFRFFLPAFVRVSVTDYDRADITPDAIVWKFTKMSDPFLIPYVEERLRVLSVDQKCAILDFIKWLHHEHPEDFSPTDLKEAEETLST